MQLTLLEKAKKSFAEAASGAFRGRDSFCRLLDAMSHLRVSGLLPELETSYAAIKTTKQEFETLLRSQYRRAALENYQDSRDENFLASGRRAHEALSDLHLVPVYMKLGGLDPALEESWTTCGINREDYLAVRRARLG